MLLAIVTNTRELLHRSVPDRHRQFARAMRGDATKAENMLWQALRGRQLEGFKIQTAGSIRWLYPGLCMFRSAIDRRGPWCAAR
ncbi:DUF559 domain-containing protein [Rhizobium leucaenae]|uniref:DUF559 domain-containing protein n=1 Tax=Rhizobium leucaenae TaxID=29450 RepID=UPI003CC916DC